MTKQLKDMSLKELWALFPIILTPHNEKWANWYKKAKEYEQLKLSLWKKYEHNRDKYTNEKSQFVNEILKTKKL